MRSTSKLQDREIRWSLKEGIPGKSREVNNFCGAGETELSGRVPPLVFWMVWNKKFSQLPPLLFCYCCCCCRMFWGTFRPSSTGNLQTQDSGHEKFFSMIRKSGGVYHFLSVDSYLKFISGNWRKWISQRHVQSFCEFCFVPKWQCRIYFGFFFPEWCWCSVRIHRGRNFWHLCQQVRTDFDWNKT